MFLKVVEHDLRMTKEVLRFLSKEEDVELYNCFFPDRL